MTFLDRIKETSTSTGTGTFTLSGAAVGYKAFTNGMYKYCIVNSTETEWEVGEGTVASGVLTRTTIEASSNAGSAVNFSAGTKYVFNTVSAAYVNSLVPYTGATASVNLGEFGLTAGQLTLDTSPTGTAVVGTTQWNDTIGSSQTLLKGGNVLLKNGVDLVARVVNKVSPATTLTKAAYQAVRVSGAQGQRLAVAYAQANNDNNSADAIGLVCENIAANQEGFIITVGQLSEINTTGSLQGETWADGDVLYLSPTTAGNLTNIKPNGSTGHIVVIGYVEYAHAVHGSIYVKIMNGWEISELHDCYINSPANNEVLTYESSTSLWKNKSISTILGYTPQAAITLTTTGTSGAATFVSNTLNIPQYQGALTLTTTGNSGAATLIGNTLNIPQYNGGGISGSGTAGQVTYWSGTSAVTGSSNLFWDNTNGRLGIGTNAPSGILDVYSAPLSASVLKIGTSQNFSITANTQSTNRFQLFNISRIGSPSIEAVSIGVGTGPTAGSGVISANNDNLIFGYAFSGTFNETYRITSQKNLLLGTTADLGYRLDVNGTGASTGALRVTGGLSLFQGGKMTIAAATTSYASLNIPSGTAPTTPANGDIWQDGTNIYIRMGGSTKTFTIV